MLIKQDYENKIKNQWISANNISKKYVQNKNFCKITQQNKFTQYEQNTIFNAVGGNKTIFNNIVKKVDENENQIEANNQQKNLENQIEIFQKKQKLNSMKNNQLMDEINDIEKKKWRKK